MAKTNPATANGETRAAKGSLPVPRDSRIAVANGVSFRPLDNCERAARSAVGVGSCQPSATLRSSSTERKALNEFMKSKRDCLIGQDVKRQLTQRYREIGIPNTDSSDFLSAAVPRSGKQAEALAMRQPSDESPVTVVVADDHLVILEGLIKILNSQKDIRVVASAADGQEVSKLYYQFLPDVLMLDLRLPKKDGLQVLNELMARVNPKPRMVIFRL